MKRYLHHWMTSRCCLHCSSTAFGFIMSPMVWPWLNLYAQLILVKLWWQGPIQRWQCIRPVKTSTERIWVQRPYSISQHDLWDDGKPKNRTVSAGPGSAPAQSRRYRQVVHAYWGGLSSHLSNLWDGARRVLNGGRLRFKFSGWHLQYMSTGIVNDQKHAKTVMG